MQGDSELQPQTPPRRNLQELPKIRGISIERRQYRPPRKHAVAGEIVEFTEGIEIIVQTEAEIPIRALSPALFVGKVEVAENEQVDATTYRFFVLDEGVLREGAPIVLGWVGQPPPNKRSQFRYEIPGAAGTRR